MSAPANRPALSATGIGKRYGATVALRDVAIDLLAGEVHGLVGENGAGKSTLVKILSGAVAPDAGVIRVGGEVARLTSPHAALRAGVSTIFQELTLAPDLTVAENISLGREPSAGRVVLRRRRRRALARDALASLGAASVDPDAPVRSLGLAQQQIVEIAKAVSRPATRALVMDEPTAALSGGEVDVLLDVVRGLRARGMAVLYVTHRLEELDAIGDQVTVMRDGGVVLTRPQRDVSQDEVVAAMVGRRMSEFFPPRPPAAPGPVALRVDGVRVEADTPPVSFGLRAGEVLGLFGVMGSGRTELTRCLAGIDRPAAGEIWLDDVRIRPRGAGAGLRSGVGMLPEDRKGAGIVPAMSVADNIALSAFDDVSRGPLLSRARRARAARQAIDGLRIKTGDPSSPIATLSGGNQQKCLVGRLLAVGPRVLLLDEPTRGIDVGAKTEIYEIVNRLVAEGKSLLVVTSDLAEALGICDRILVLRHGAVVAERRPAETDGHEMLALAIGADGRQSSATPGPRGERAGT